MFFFWVCCTRCRWGYRERDPNTPVRKSRADGEYWSALADAHWRCFEVQGLRGQGVHLLRAAEAYAHAVQALSNVSDVALWTSSMKPLLRLGAVSSVAQVPMWRQVEAVLGTCCGRAPPVSGGSNPNPYPNPSLFGQVVVLLPDLPLVGDLPPSFRMAAAEVFSTLGLFEQANAQLFGTLVESGPPPTLTQEHLLFAMGRLFVVWSAASQSPEEAAARAGQGEGLLAQACELSRSAARSRPVTASSAPVPEPTLASWLRDGATFRGYGDAFTAAGLHLMAQVTAADEESLEPQSCFWCAKHLTEMF